ncbi:hypothetical protein [Flavobacterium sp. MK4S-17]|uniref:hypothetical protein n=1 Tax=Flavobacterium sp. MK4S-17 TaxID=2543737 RepID=UPI00135B8F0D|nr:hypothetical protein [Flavobacterium sp. MK4S-17]
MAQISKIKENISFLQSKVEELKASINERENNFVIKIQIHNLNSEIKSLQKILYQENVKRNKEIVALRLIGGIAKDGTFPLHSVGGITDTFQILYSKHHNF